MRSIIAGALVLLALTAPAAHAQYDYRRAKVDVVNRTTYAAATTLTYVNCKPFPVRIAGVSPTEKEKQVDGKLPAMAQPCVLRDVRATLEGTKKRVTQYSSNTRGPTGGIFVIVLEGDDAVIKSDPRALDKTNHW